MQLATLQPGVIVSRATARDFTGGFGTTQLAIGGARPEQTGYLMDGTNIADISDKAPSSLRASCSASTPSRNSACRHTATARSSAARRAAS